MLRARMKAGECRKPCAPLRAEEVEASWSPLTETLIPAAAEAKRNSRFPEPPLQAQWGRRGRRSKPEPRRTAARTVDAQGRRARARALCASWAAPPEEQEAPQHPPPRHASSGGDRRAPACDCRLHGQPDPARLLQPLGSPPTDARRELLP